MCCVHILALRMTRAHNNASKVAKFLCSIFMLDKTFYLIQEQEVSSADKSGSC